MLKEVSLKVKPPKWVERVIYCSTYGSDREEYLLDLRSRYRSKVLHQDREAANRMARREGAWWLGVMCYRAIMFFSVIERLSTRLRGG